MSSKIEKIKQKISDMIMLGKSTNTGHPTTVVKKKYSLNGINALTVI